MLRLHPFLEAAKAKIAAALPELRSCEIHHGAFDGEELRRFTAKPPGLRLALLAVPAIERDPSGCLDAEVRLGAFLVTRDRPGLDRTAAAINLTEALIALIEGRDWRFENAHPPRLLEVENLYAGTLKSAGTALFRLSWSQKIRLGLDVFAAEGQLPRALYLGIAPDIGLGHEDDYVKIAEVPGGAPDA